MHHVLTNQPQNIIPLKSIRSIYRGTSAYNKKLVMAVVSVWPKLDQAVSTSQSEQQEAAGVTSGFNLNLL